MSEFNPATRTQAERSIVGMPPKAYRWVDEMREIGKAFSEDGGWAADEAIYRGVAEVYGFVADKTPLGEERTEQRTRTTLESVLLGLTEGLEDRERNQRQ
jgi:hypothetical protein